MTTKQKAYTALAATSIIWGTTWVAMKFGVRNMPPLQLASIRQFIASVIFIMYFLLRKEALPTRKQFQQLFLLGILTFVFSNGVSTMSLKYLPSGLAALIGALYPLSVVIIEFVFYKNRNINLSTIIGIFLGIGGMVVVFYDNAFHNHSDGYAFGITLAIIAMLAWSWATILLAKKTVKINSYYSMGWQMLFSSIIIFIISIASGKNIPVAQIPTVSWLAIAYLIIAGSVIAVIAFVYSMQHLPPAVAALYAYVNPLVAIFIGTFLLDEHLTLSIILGSIITLVGVYLVNRSMKKQTLAITDVEGI